MRGLRARLLAGAGALLAVIAGCGPSGGPGDAAGDGAGRAPGSGPAPGTGPLPPVLDHVPTRDGVVFLTYDDGAERDPRFIELVRERGLPVSMFLTDSVVGPGYAHFARLRAVGASLQNHTLDHPALRGLPYAGQRAEICGQQRKLASRFGVRPRLFRPPYGTYDATTLRAAADCGIEAVVLWRVTLEPDGHLTYTHGPHHLNPGDIVSVPSGESPTLSLAERTERLLGELRQRGLRVGRLEDHTDRTAPPPSPTDPPAPPDDPAPPSTPPRVTVEPAPPSAPTRATVKLAPPSTPPAATGERRSPSSPSGV